MVTTSGSYDTPLLRRALDDLLATTHAEGALIYWRPSHQPGEVLVAAGAVRDVDDAAINVNTPDHHAIDGGWVFPLSTQAWLLVFADADAPPTLDDEVELLRVLVKQMINDATPNIETLLRRLNRLSSTAVSPQQVLDELKDSVLDETVCCAAVFYFDSGSSAPYDTLQLWALYTDTPANSYEIGTRFEVGSFHESQALAFEQSADGRRLFVSDTDDLTRQFEPLVRMLLPSPNVQGWAGVQLVTNGHNIGAMLFGCREERFRWTMLRTFEMLSDVVALVLTAHHQLAHTTLVQRGVVPLLDAVSDAVMVTTIDAHSAHVISVNRQFTQMFDLPRLDVRGLSLDDLLEQMRLPQSTRHGLSRAWKRIRFNDFSAWEGEFELVMRDGVAAAIVWYSEAIRQGDDILGRVYVFRDITPDRAADRLRYSLISRVSHEMRTPLTSIGGFSEFIIEEFGSELPEKVLEYMDIILSSAHHLNDVYSTMIEISRADAGIMELTIVETDIVDVLQHMLAQFDTDLQKRKQHVDFRFQNNIPPVFADVNRLTQLIAHLLQNAVKFTPTETTITVQVEHITDLDDLPPGSPADMALPAALVTVRDEGQGIPEAEVEHIFLPFYRTDLAGRNRVHGAGLGLALARSIVELHRGRIWAEAHKNGGVFRFTLPTKR